MKRLMRLSIIVTLAATAPCKSPDDLPDSGAPGAPSAAAASAPAATMDPGLVQRRDDWAAFEQGLSTEPAKAAAKLEDYRQRYGLPFDFFVNEKAPEALQRKVRNEEDDGMCGSLAKAFVKRMPTSHAVLQPSGVVEIDSVGRVITRWFVSSDVEFWQIVVGAEGDELIARIPGRPEGVYLRVKPDGEFRVVSAPPMEVPPMQQCPQALADEGSICGVVHDGGKPRRLAYPIPCT